MWYVMLPREVSTWNQWTDKKLILFGEKRGSLVVEVTISYVMEFASEKVLLMVGQNVRVHYKVGSNHDFCAILPLNSAGSLR